MNVSTEELMDIACLYWRTDRIYDFATTRSPEQIRLSKRWEQELANLDRWWTFLHELESELPTFTIGDATATLDACLRCVAYSRVDSAHRFAIVGCVSILAPIHSIYCLRYESDGIRARPQRILEPLSSEMQTAVAIVGRKIEAFFETTVLPSRIAETRVPLVVHDREPPLTTLFDAILTNQPENIP